MPILIDKPIGWTPLQALDALRIRQPELKDAKLAYAGRLDPIASGLMVVLVDDECNDRDRFQSLEKTYEFKAILGFETDTYDIMGLAKVGNGGAAGEQSAVTQEQISAALDQVRNITAQPYPPFSSKVVNGKPLFWYARHNQQPAEIPSKEIKVSELELLGSKRYPAAEIAATIHNRITYVTGDFRQVDILKIWYQLLAEPQTVSSTSRGGLDINEYIELHLRATVSSGTYIRGLVNELGKILGTGAVAYDIHRTKVGDYLID